MVQAPLDLATSRQRHASSWNTLRAEDILPILTAIWTRTSIEITSSGTSIGAGHLAKGGAAAGHLINQGVRRGDLFLFFGLFQELSPGQPRRYAGPRHHRIYGWLQIGDVLGLDGDGSRVLQRYPWLRNHPHARPGWDGFANHTIYVASEKLHIDGMPTEIPGSGVFANGIVLIAPGKPASIWQVPNWLHPGKGGTGLTYHPAGRWLPDGLVQSAYRGQEFVADGENRVDVRDWLAETMEEQANG